MTASGLLVMLAILAGGCSRATESRLPSVATNTAVPAPQATTESTLPAPATTFAVIGDYGMDNSHERAVADLVASWRPAFVIALGDDYYRPAGGTGTGKYDESTGAYYGAWLKDITTTGKRHPVGSAKRNAFFPALGNHDYSDATPSPKTYLTYFKLPGTGLLELVGQRALLRLR